MSGGWCWAASGLLLVAGCGGCFVVSWMGESWVVGRRAGGGLGMWRVWAVRGVWAACVGCIGVVGMVAVVLDGCGGCLGGVVAGGMWVLVV